MILDIKEISKTIENTITIAKTFNENVQKQIGQEYMENRITGKIKLKKKNGMHIYN